MVKKIGAQRRVLPHTAPLPCRSLRRYAKQLQCVRVAKKFSKSEGANCLADGAATARSKDKSSVERRQEQKDNEGARRAEETLADRRQEVRKMPQLTTAL